MARPAAAGRRAALRTLASLGAVAAISALGTRAAPVAAAPARFPSRPVRIVVPYSVGIGPDVVARALGDYLSQAWGVPVVIDNKPGASGIVAFTELRQVAPDGHTLFIGDVGSLAVNPLIHTALPYDPLRDVAPISTLFRATFVLQVGGASPYQTAGDLLAAARKSPGRISYGSFGNGHPMHVAVERFARAGNLEFLHVPFRDGGTLMTAVANGDVDFTPLSVHTTAGLLKSGKLRPLAVAAAQRLKDWPQLPTVAEAGGPAVEMRPWAALVAVNGTPPETIARIQRDVAAGLAAPEVRVRVEGAGFEIWPSTPAQLSALMAADAADAAVLVREGRVRMS